MCRLPPLSHSDGRGQSITGTGCRTRDSSFSPPAYPGSGLEASRSWSNSLSRNSGFCTMAVPAAGTSAGAQNSMAAVLSGRELVSLKASADKPSPEACAFAPGTGTPEVGGLTTVEALTLLRGLRRLELIGGDVVEVAPPFDPAGNTALVAATLMYEILCLLASRRTKPA
jgi:hypothetical protein